MTPGRTKAEEVLSVMNDIADDLLLEAGEEAVEEFWDRVRLGVNSPALNTKAKRDFWDVMSPFIGGGAAFGASRDYAEQILANRASSSSTTATAGTADRPTVPADSSSGSPPG